MNQMFKNRMKSLMFRFKMKITTKNRKTKIKLFKIHNNNKLLNKYRPIPNYYYKFKKREKG